MADKITNQELEQYVRNHGYELSDLTEGEKEEALEELASEKEGHGMLDGVFSPLGPVWIRKTASDTPSPE